MKCEEAHRELHEAAKPEQALSTALHQHLNSCARCQALREELVQLREELRGLPAAPLPTGFELALRRRLKAEAEARRAGAGQQRLEQLEARPRAGWRERVFSIAAAAGVLLVIGALTSFIVVRMRAQDGGSGAQFALHLSVESAAEHRNALFDLQLPPGIRLTPAAAAALPFSGATVSWRSHLRPGRNELDLPLLVEQPGVLHLALRAGGRSLATTVQVGAASASRPGSLLVAWRVEDDSPREVRQ